MMYPTPQSGPQRSHTTRNVLIVVGILVLLCCGGLTTGGVLLFRKVKDSIGPASTTVDTFLNHLEDGSTATAYAELCQPTRTKFTLEQFTQVVNGRPKLLSHTITNTNVANYNGHASASVHASLHYADSSTDAHRFELAKENASWHVCGQPF